MKLIIDIPDEVLKSRHYCLYFGAWSTKLTEAIENGIPYDKVIDEVTELLENEWGYEGMRDDVARIMKGGADNDK